MTLHLTAAQQRALARDAHHLRVIVSVGAAGLTEAVIAELDRALGDHELVKIKLAGGDRRERHAMIETACARLQADCVQAIGHTATLYRPKPDSA